MRDIIDVLGKLLESRRKELGLSQGDVAKSAGVSQHTISVVENGKSDTSTRTIFKLAHALGLNIPELYEDAIGAASIYNHPPRRMRASEPQSHANLGDVWEEMHKVLGEVQKLRSAVIAEAQASDSVIRKEAHTLVNRLNEEQLRYAIAMMKAIAPVKDAK